RLAELLGVLSFGADLGMGQPMEHVLRQCLISLRLAERMGLDEADREVVYYTSLGVPKGVRGEQILLTSRLVALADVVEVFHRAGGTDAAVAVARQRRGTQFDPQVVDVFTGQAASVLAGLDEASSWDAVIGAEPAR